jgi:PAS domain S-box-containing protein
MSDQQSSTKPHGPIESAPTEDGGLRSPPTLWLITTLTVFAGEIIVMIILSTLRPLPVLVEAVLDGLMITAIATPALYFFLYQPMVRHIRRRKVAEDALIELNEELEDRVSARTTELKQANNALLKEVEERRRAEQDLLKTNEFVQKVVESAPCMLLIFDAESMSCTYVNSAVTELLGYTPDQVQLADRLFFDQVLDAEDRARFADIIRGIGQEDDSPVITCFNLNDARGERRPFRVRISVFATTPLTEPELILWSAIDLGRDPT